MIWRMIYDPPGGWWVEAEVDGALVKVIQTGREAWTASVDGKRVGRRMTQYDAQALGVQKATRYSARRTP